MYRDRQLRDEVGRGEGTEYLRGKLEKFIYTYRSRIRRPKDHLPPYGFPDDPHLTYDPTPPTFDRHRVNPWVRRQVKTNGPLSFVSVVLYFNDNLPEALKTKRDFKDTKLLF